MPFIHESALEHLTAIERACVVRYLDLLHDRLGPRLIEVHLFGSFARGDAWRSTSSMHSDVDLLVVCSDRPAQSELENFVNATYPLFLECGRQLSPQFRTREDLESPTTDAGLAFLKHFRSDARLIFAV